MTGPDSLSRRFNQKKQEQGLILDADADTRRVDRDAELEKLADYKRRITGRGGTSSLKGRLDAVR